MARKGLTADIILKTAAKIISENGFDQFSLRELANKLDVKAASLYNHIHSLSELTSNIGKLTLQKMSEKLYANLQGKTPADAISQIATEYRKFAKENPELYKTIIKIPATGTPSLIEEGRAIVHKLYPVFAAYGLSEKDIIHFSRIFRSTMHGFITLEEAGFFNDAVNADESYAQMTKAMIALLALKREDSAMKTPIQAAEKEKEAQS